MNHELFTPETMASAAPRLTVLRRELERLQDRYADAERDNTPFPHGSRAECLIQIQALADEVAAEELIAAGKAGRP